MTILKPGDKRPIGDIAVGRTVRVTITHAPSDIDVSAFGLDADRRIGDERYVVLFSNPSSPDGSITYSKDGDTTTIAVELDRVPATIERISVVATHDDIPLREAQKLIASLGNGLDIDLKPFLGAEKAVMLFDVYRHGGDWKLGTVVQGFNGGLASLIEHFGGEVAADDDTLPTAPPPEPTPLPKPLSKVDLRKNKVGVSLKKHGIEHETAEVEFVIDASGSMRDLYADGTVQDTVERVVPVALRLDDDGSMDTWFYASQARQTEPLTIDNVEGFVAREMPSPGAAPARAKSGLFGNKNGAIGYGNNEPVVMNQIMKDIRPGRARPRLVIFLTDGGIDLGTSEVIKDILRKASDKAVFWQFVGVGHADYGVLRDLDTIDGRVVDNAGFFAIDDLKQISDDELYDRMLSEFPIWLRAARAAGILA